MKFPPDSRTKQRFILTGNTPAAWFLSADSLLAGARVLISQLQPPSDGPIGSPVPPEEKLLSPAFLLYGFALECLLKGLWLRQGNELVIGEKYVGIPGIGGHELHNIAKKVNFTVNDQEHSVLYGLHVKLVSSSRYPVGTHWSKHRPVYHANGGFGSHTTFNSGDIPIIETMAARLITALGYDG